GRGGPSAARDNRSQRQRGRPSCRNASRRDAAPRFSSRGRHHPRPISPALQSKGFMTMQIAIGLYEGFAALDAIGPYQVLTSLPGAEVLFCAERTGIVADEDRMLRVDVTRTFADTPRPDLLLVPGGLNTRLIAKDGVPIVEWIKAAHPHTTYTTSVCTGALLL